MRLGNRVIDHFGERQNRASAFHGELTAYEVQGLNTICAFIDLSNTGVTYKLAHALLVDVAVATVDLLSFHTVCKTNVCEVTFDHRGEQGHHVVALFAHGFVIA